jgi:competence protein ComGC
MINKNKKGFSFVEMILVIGFVALISATILFATDDTKNSKSSIKKNECVVNCIGEVNDSEK